MNLSFQDKNLDQVHRIGKTYTDKNTGKKVRSIITKFNSRKSHQQFYNARLKHFTNSKWKPVKWKPERETSKWKSDLTRRQYLLLNKAKRLTLRVHTVF